jgi:hypothetical protein
VVINWGRSTKGPLLNSATARPERRGFPDLHFSSQMVR